MSASNSKKLAQAWQRNALFRVLAFLDSTGEQDFDLATEVDSHGAFLRPDTLFAESTAIHAVLSAGLEAFRENVSFLFADEAEKRALLCVVGAGTRQLAPVAQGGDAGAAHATPSPPMVAKNATPLAAPEDTRWSRAVLRPEALASFPACFCGDFTFNLLCRLEEVMGVPATSCTDTPLVEQFFVDALDRWMSSRADADNHRMVLACGLQPAVLEVAEARKGEQPFALVDFVIDVVYPPPEELHGEEASEAGGGDGPLQDWLLLTYQHNHETIDVEAEESRLPPEETERGEEGDHDGPDARRVRHEDDLGDWQPKPEEDGEVVLTADNIDRYMREDPSVIPAGILRQKRKSWKDPSITLFELEHHYTLPELKLAVKELASLAGASADVVAAWESAAVAETSRREGGEECVASSADHRQSYVVGSATASVLAAATRATKKADILQLLLRLHRPNTTEEQGHHGGSAEEAQRGGEQQKKEADEESLSISDVALSAAQLIRHFSLKDLQAHVESILGVGKAPATKNKCARLIVAQRRGTKP